MRVVNHSQGETGAVAASSLSKQLLEINAKHPIMRGLAAQRSTDPLLASLVAEQIFDNALVSAGLLDDSRSMLPRLNSLLARIISPPSAEK